MKVVYLVGEFPRISKTFVIDPIIRLLEEGHEVEIVGKRPRNEAGIHHEVVDQYNLLERTHYPPSIPDSYLSRFPLLLRYLALELRRKPARLIGIFQYILQRLRAMLERGERPRITPLLIARPLFEIDYDVLHVHFGYNAIVAAELRRAGLIEGPLVVTFHGTDLNVYPKNHSDGVYEIVFAMSDVVTVGSEFGRGQLLGLGAPKEQIRVLPVGINLDHFVWTGSQKREEEKARVITVARLVEVKGIRYAIEAVARLREQGRSVQYWIVGDGPKRSELEALVSSLGIGESTTFFGAVTKEKILDFYKQAHLFLLPGVQSSSGAVETQGIVLAEAQAVGLPVIATNCGGMPESIRNGESGVLVPPRDVDVLVDTLENLLDAPHHWSEMGRKGRAYVKKRFNVDTQMKELLKLYRKLKGDKLS